MTEGNGVIHLEFPASLATALKFFSLKFLGEGNSPGKMEKCSFLNELLSEIFLSEITLDLLRTFWKVWMRLTVLFLVEIIQALAIVKLSSIFFFLKNCFLFYNLIVLLDCFIVSRQNKHQQICVFQVQVVAEAWRKKCIHEHCDSLSAWLLDYYL